MSKIAQQDAKIYSLFISVNCSTCFVWYLHPSSGAHIIVSTASGMNETVTASYWRYSDMSSWWLVEIPPETGRAFYRYNKLYIVAFYWTIIDANNGDFVRRSILNLPEFVLWLETCQSKMCRENQNTQFNFNNFLPQKIVPFLKYCGKISYILTENRWQYGACAIHAG